jgi:hypothetical protein
MKIENTFSRAQLLGAASLAAATLLSVTWSDEAKAAGAQKLPVIAPVMSCEQLVGSDVSKVAGVPVTIRSASVRDTDKGQYCRVLGMAEPGIYFAGDLPIKSWTQRFLQGAQGREGIERAGGCMPALNGEIAVVTQGGGPGGGGGMFEADPAAGDWGTSPQARINSAYLGQHLTAVAFKAVIKVFYGRGPKFSYMAGCSGGGAQTLMEAERFPKDFDGYSIGAPPLYQTVHDFGFWHGWEYHANQRKDGSIILAADKLPILHAAAIQHCGAVSGVMDGGLQQPTACKFEKSWVQCAAGASDTSKCLTAEEANVAEQLYLGPNDGKNFFEISGYPLGSEQLWRLSTTGKPADNEGLTPHGLHSFMMPPESGETTKQLMARFEFSQDWYDKTIPMRPLFNVGNTNLRPLQRNGGKILLWNGAEDNVVQPAGTIAYYEAVQKELGLKQTDSFLRFFLLPGVGHCGNGDGANQIDTLTPLMAWVESNAAPTEITVGRPVPTPAGQRGGGGPQVPGAVPAYPPYALPSTATVYTRPVYAFPDVAKYKGTGDPNDAANYVKVGGPLKTPQVFTNEAIKLVGADNQKFYHVENGQLVADK